MESTNEIIYHYLNTNESIDEIIEKYHDRDQYLEVVFFEITKELLQKELNQKLLQSIDKAIIKGHPNINLYCLFIALAIGYNCRFLQLEKANSLCSIGLSLSHEDIHPMIRAIYAQHRAGIYRAEGKINDAKKLMQESILMVDKNFPRYVILLINFLNVQASLGELKENGEYKFTSFDWSILKDNSLQITILKVINCCVTGNYKEGNALIDDYQKSNLNELPPYLIFYKNPLDVIAGDFKESNYPETVFKHFVNAFNCLATGRFEEANKFHEKLIKENFTHPFLNRFSVYVPLHYAICLGNKGMANWLLLEKIKKGDVHYLDDLFYGRVQLLENDIEKAEQTFTRLIENVNRYGAINRLKFELQFAKEMKLSVVLRLINGWKSDVKTTAVKINIKELEKPLPIEKGLKLLVGKSHQISQVKELVKKYSSLKAPILVTGETGTGKELISRAIHDEGKFPNEPFIAINCGALTDTLLQSELFGYEAGAFTGAQKQRQGIFEAAGKGTVFLDEFGDISPKLQVSLLRVLEANEIRMIGSTNTRKIECKIVVATNIDLNNAVADKRFREDLFFRLARFEIKLPSLKERLEDLPVLIQYFLDKNTNKKDSVKISKELLDKLLEYHWPGNIRELKNEIDRLFILNPDFDVLGLAHFDFTHLQKAPEISLISQKVKPLNLPSNAPISSHHEDHVLKVIQKGFPVEKRHALIKEIFSKHKKLSRSQIMEIACISTTTATKDLQMLIDIGFIVRRKPTKSSRTDYFELVEQNEK